MEGNGLWFGLYIATLSCISFLMYNMSLVSGISSGVPFAQYLFEGPAEIIVEDCIDDGVQRAVAIAKPEKKIEQSQWHVAGDAYCLKHVREEKGEPADNKDPDHHGQDKSEALLTVLSAFPPAPFVDLDTFGRLIVSRFDLAQFGFAPVAFLFDRTRVIHFMVRG